MSLAVKLAIILSVAFSPSIEYNRLYSILHWFK